MDERPLKIGCDYLRDKNWNRVVVTKKGALAITSKRMPAELARCGFVATICDCGGYWRGNYGK